MGVFLKYETLCQWQSTFLVKLRMNDPLLVSILTFLTFLNPNKLVYKDTKTYCLTFEKLMFKPDTAFLCYIYKLQFYIRKKCLSISQVKACSLMGIKYYATFNIYIYLQFWFVLLVTRHKYWQFKKRSFNTVVL